MESPHTPPASVPSLALEENTPVSSAAADDEELEEQVCAAQRETVAARSADLPDSAGPYSWKSISNRALMPSYPKSLVNQPSGTTSGCSDALHKTGDLNHTKHAAIQAQDLGLL